MPEHKKTLFDDRPNPSVRTFTLSLLVTLVFGVFRVCSLPLDLHVLPWWLWLLSELQQLLAEALAPGSFDGIKDFLPEIGVVLFAAV